MAFKDTILTKVSAVVDSVWPSKKPKVKIVKSEATESSVVDENKINNVLPTGRGGRNSHIVYKKK